MSKDLLKEAIADAKAVRETAIANAKLALEEAFTPKLQSMLSTKIREDYDEEEDEMESEAIQTEMEMDDEEEMEKEAKLYDDEAEEEEKSEAKMYDEDEEEMKAEDAMEDLGLDDAYGSKNEDEEDDDEDKMENLELEAIIRELEEDEDHDDDEKEKMESVNEEEEDEEEKTEAVTEDSELDLAEVIKALQEEDEEDEEEMKAEATELEEAYETIRFLKDKINEVNLLNAKLLFSNKLFRNGNLNEDQKMRVIETFDRANSVREVKLVYSTLAESMKASKSSTKKKAMTEGLASKTTRSTKPSKKAIVESNDFSDRMRKLAGLI